LGKGSSEEAYAPCAFIMRRLHLYELIFIISIFLFGAECRDVKIVEGQKDSESSNGMTYDGYDDYYDGYYAGGWPLEDDKSNFWEQQEEGANTEKTPKETATGARVEKKRAHPGPLLFQSIQNACFRSDQIENEGVYIFCPFRNVTLNYEIRKQEESLSMGSFSHWSTQRVGETVRLTQVYKNGFYCRMGDEHQTIVTFGCQEEVEAWDEDEDHAFLVQGAVKGTYSRQGQSDGGIVNGSVLRGEADYWHAEEEGCVYKLLFSLPFSCAELSHIGLSVAIDSREQDVPMEAAVDESGALAEPGMGMSADQEQMLRQWAAWGVRLGHALGGSGLERDTSVSDKEDLLDDGDENGVSSAASMPENTLEEPSLPEAEVGGSCCGELATLRMSLRELSGLVK
jgi:hypothetical protein